MTSTSFNVGLNSATRNSSKVLKPPGGGSSDIFGASAAENVEPQRKLRTHLTSSIFGEESAATPSRNKAGNNSFYNLFGGHSQVGPASAFKDQSKSNLVFEDQHTINPNNDVVKKSLTFAENNSVIHTNTGTTDKALKQNEHRELSGSVHSNPGNSHDFQDGGSVGEGPAMNGVSSSASSAAPTPAPTPTAATPAAGKQRVPPGGFSSGLW